MHCVWCDSYFVSISWTTLFGLREDDTLCEKCRQSLTIISGEICRVCGRMLEMAQAEYVDGNICVDCMRWQEDLNWKLPFQNRSLYVYDEPMKQFISRYKFRGDAMLIEAIRADWKRLWERQKLPQALIVPVPLSDARMYERGFNQSRVLAELLEVELSDILTRPYDYEKQSKKSRKERLSTGTVFELKKGIDIKKATAIIIDDIYTTGMTVRQAAKTLYEHGAHHVSSLTLARGL